jgi:FCP1-like phosphatase family protein
LNNADDLQEATRIEEKAKRRLLQSRKLSLVVDLDETIVCSAANEAVKDAQALKLMDDDYECTYYIKFRPGLKDFLQNISKLYELHIYTLGWRGYAQAIAKIVDPQRKIFGDRIMGWDENGRSNTKKLQRLFPLDTNMAVIIDDNGDVWGWIDNLIKVAPYHSFEEHNDIELLYLEQSLTEVHRTFFQEYDKALAGSQGSRVAELRGGKNTRKLPLKNNSDVSVDLQLVPDIKTIMAQMKLRVLEGVVLVFSGAAS